jgi:carboxyl-terminal processing protease
MSPVAKHLVIAGLAVPIGLAGYHVLVGGGLADGPGGEGGGALDAFGDLALGSGYELDELDLLNRNLFQVEQRYVDRQRLDPEAMFQAALDRVERSVDEVLFVREPKGRRLQISVGSFTTMLVLEPIQTIDDLHRQLQRVAAVLGDHLSEEVKRPEVEYSMINGALSTLDPHTVLLPPEAAHDMDVDNQGEFGGLGIEINITNGELTVKSPMDGTPAKKVGLQSEDVITRIEDESTVNMDLTEAVRLLRGKPGTEVNIQVKRKGLSKPLKFTIVRELIRVDPMEGRLLQGDVGYVHIKAFNDNTSADLDRFLQEFARGGKGQLKGLVLDLRDNGGGYLNQAVEVVDRFLTDGVIVATVEGATGRREEQRAQRAGTEQPYPIVVLVNGSSASASEIVAGALRNQNRAIIVGERSFGKGSVQHLYPNKDTSKLKLTVAKYLTPGDQSIQNVGISPDILLEPSVVRPARKGKNGEEQPQLGLLYWRDWLTREADLDHHLDNNAEMGEPPAYSVRYLLNEAPEGDKDPSKDWEVGFAREVVLAATGSRRAEVLQAAAPIVAQRQKAESAHLQQAFTGLGVDWSPGAAPAEPALTVRLNLGEDGLLKAGQPEDVVLEVTNNGTAPVHQLSALTESGNIWLDHREFHIGRLNPGETRKVSQRVELHQGYGSEVVPVEILLRDASSGLRSNTSARVEVQGQAMPLLSYSIKLFDDGSGQSKGNGNGVPEVGETVDLEVTLTNNGTGATGNAYARLKNRSGKPVDLVDGSGFFGAALDLAGKSCDPEVASDCGHRLEPGKSHTERLSLRLREAPRDGAWTFKLQVGDDARYDYATVQRGGFYDFVRLEEEIKLKPGQKVEPWSRSPPRIEVTRQPGVRSEAQDVVISGAAHDKSGVRDLMIYHGEEKIFYRGGDAAAQTVPFSVEPHLSEGTNLLYVLARDSDGLVSSTAVNIWYGEGKGKASR